MGYYTFFMGFVKGYSDLTSDCIQVRPGPNNHYSISPYIYIYMFICLFNRATVSSTSNRPQNNVGNHLGVCIRHSSAMPILYNSSKSTWKLRAAPFRTTIL